MLERQYHTRNLREAQQDIEAAHNDLLHAIVEAREDGQFTFQEISDALGRNSKGAVHHLYQKGKERGY